MEKSLKEQLKRKLSASTFNASSLEKSAGLAPGTVGHILTGKSKDPHVGTIIKIGDKLGCTVYELLGLDNKESKSAYQFDSNDCELVSDCLTKLVKTLEAKTKTFTLSEIEPHLYECVSYSKKLKLSKGDDNYIKYYVINNFS